MLIEIALFSALTALASTAHGGDRLSKGAVIALHAISSLLVSYPLVIAVGLYWAFFRRGKQAEAELNYLSDKGKLKAVRKAYYLWVGYLIAPAIAKLKNRRAQEFVGSLIIGAILATPTCIIQEILL